MEQDKNARTRLVGGMAGWVLGRLRAGGRARSRLELVERITLAPRQSLALVEAEGRRFLVATSPEGAPAFYALDELPRLAANRPSGSARPAARVSW
jgi:flagellar biogenesis protein FliO